ncbi:TPA: toxin-antitoxin system HicB family antitoxin [Klebsiella oxytoca]|uniref:Toxin-antitoxin system HicB family antitoxin n=1 Tax=Klebsiella oxytoca TaxID=571 RepID=A0AAN5RH47_KLEOX|nr:toxin-antitoxin system HicB family antitoxin [Klebsiella oxytoca]
MKYAVPAFMISAIQYKGEPAPMAKKSAPELSPIVPRPVDTTTADHRAGDTKPIQIRIDPLLHRDIKIAATEQGKTIMECYEYWRRMNK